MSDDTPGDAVLVTGANGGIGAATVRALADRRVPVFAAVHSSAESVPDLPGVRVIEMDVADSGSVKAAQKLVASEVGESGLRAIVNNAGVIVQGPLEIVPPEDLERQFAVNTLGPTYVSQAFLPLIRNGLGRIINVSAPTAWIPVPFLAPIGASKSALESLSTALRTELAAWRVPVVLVEPGTTDTSIFGKAQRAADTFLAADPIRASDYGPHLSAVAKAASRQRLAAPDKAANAIVRAIEARRPKRWYAASTEVRLMRMIARLPAGLRDRLVARMFGLSGIKAAT